MDFDDVLQRAVEEETVARFDHDDQNERKKRDDVIARWRAAFLHVSIKHFLLKL